MSDLSLEHIEWDRGLMYVKERAVDVQCPECRVRLRVYVPGFISSGFQDLNCPKCNGLVRIDPSRIVTA